MTQDLAKKRDAADEKFINLLNERAPEEMFTAESMEWAHSYGFNACYIILVEELKSIRNAIDSTNVDENYEGLKRLDKLIGGEG